MAPKLVMRNWLLDKTDWTQVSDNELTQEEREAWAVYRQSLRNIKAETIEFEWPVPPQKINVSLDEQPWWYNRATCLELKI